MVYIVKEQKTDDIRYVFSDEYRAESLQRQIEMIEDIDCVIEARDESDLAPNIKSMIDECFFYKAKG